MKTLVIVGTQWGDEGKGKITDFLAQKADVICRYQGGNNAGHTIVIGKNKYALQLIPSGIFNPNTINVMANGIVINPLALIEELQKINAREFKLFISDRAHVVMPYHIDLDGASENALTNKIGTTKKGIGPAYQDKSARLGIRMGDLLDPVILEERIKEVLPHKNQMLKSYGLPTYKAETLLENLIRYGKQLKPFITDTSKLLNDSISKGKKILFEGAQGTLLCLDHGTYPFVTSSSPTAASVPLNTGIAPWLVEGAIGVTKAYSTRVGEGAFPTEIGGDLAHYIREKGHEYGTVTGRPRRVGYLDLVVINHSKQVGGLKYLAITLLDVLSGIEEIKVCVAYEVDGKEVTTIPSNITKFSTVKPVYKTLPGWQEDITQVKSFKELPKNAQNYLKFIEQVTNLEVAIFSVGPDRSQTVTLKELF